MSSIERFYWALYRRSQQKDSDEACAVLAEELLEEVQLLPENRRLSARWTIAAGMKAIELLEDKFWKDPVKQTRDKHLFPKTSGKLFGAVIDGWGVCLRKH